MEYNVTRKIWREAKLWEESCDSIVAQDVWDGVWEPQCVRDVARHAYYNTCKYPTNSKRLRHTAPVFMLLWARGSIWQQQRGLPLLASQILTAHSISFIYLRGKKRGPILG